MVSAYGILCATPIAALHRAFGQWWLGRLWLAFGRSAYGSNHTCCVLRLNRQ